MAHGENAAKLYGKEYWSRRPGNKHGGLLGAFAKKYTHKIERIRGKMEAKLYGREMSAFDD